MNAKDLLKSDLNWSKDDESGYYKSSYKGISYYLKVNDFPEEPMYSLLDDKRAFICYIEDRPKNWNFLDSTKA